MAARTQPLRLDMQLVDDAGTAVRRFAIWLDGLQQVSQDTVDLQVYEAFDQPVDTGSNDIQDVLVSAVLAGDTPPQRLEGVSVQAFQPDASQMPQAPVDAETILLSAQSKRRPGSAQRHILGTHTQRLTAYPAVCFTPGSTFLETDTTILYTSDGQNWIDPKGVLIDPDLSGILQLLPGSLGSNDKGYLYRSEYYQRTWIWDGQYWHYFGSALGAGAQVATSSSTTPPSGGLWQTCDGSTVNCALDGATVGTLTASYTGAAGGNNPFIMGGVGSTAVPLAPSAPTLASSVGVIIGNDSDAGVNITSSGSTAVALKPHSHSVALSDPTINTPTEAHGGLPRRISMAWWMRR